MDNKTLKDDIVDAIDARFGLFEGKIKGDMDSRFDSFEEKIDNKFEAFEEKIDNKLNSRFESFEGKINDKFELFEEKINNGIDTKLERFKIGIINEFDKRMRYQGVLLERIEEKVDTFGDGFKMLEERVDRLEIEVAKK